MYRLGTVTRSAQGLMIVRLDADVVDIGTDVTDDTLETVGWVVDVFGPVGRPYVAVNPATDVHPPSYIGQRLYVSDD